MRKLALSEGTNTLPDKPKSGLFRKVVFSAVVLMVILAITACGSDNVTPPQDDEPGIEETTTPPQTETPTTQPQTETPTTPLQVETPQIAEPTPATFSGTGNTPNNLANGGMVAYSNGRIYFSHPSDLSSLFSMNVDGSDVRTIEGSINNIFPSINIAGNQIIFKGGGDVLTIVNLDDGSRFIPNIDEARGGMFLVALGIYVVGDTIIYSTRRSHGVAIYASNFDGSNQRRLSGDESVENLIVADGRIYFTVRHGGEPRTLYSMNFDGSDRREIPRSDCTDIALINISEGRIVYRNYDGGINSLSIEGSDRQLLFEISGLFNNVHAIHVDGDVVYFAVHRSGGISSIYSMNIDGSNQRQLVDDTHAVSIFVAGGRVFYRSRIRQGNYVLYGMNPDGSDLRRVME